MYMTADTVSWWFDQIQKYPLLSHQETVEIFQKMPLPDGDWHTRTPKPSPAEYRLRDKIVKHNLRLVIREAKAKLKSGIPLEELIQAGNLGLIKGVERFDYTRGYKFSTYAINWIKQSIGDVVQKQKSLIRKPAHALTLQRHQIAASEKYNEEHGMEPTPEQLAALLTTDKQKVSVRLVKATQNSGRQVMSLDAPHRGMDGKTSAGDNEFTLGHTIADSALESNPEQMLNRLELSDLFKDICSKLPHKEAAILRMRMGLGEDPTDSKNYPITETELENVALHGQGLSNVSEGED